MSDAIPPAFQAKPPWIQNAAGVFVPYEYAVQFKGTAITSVEDDPENHRTVITIDGGGGGGGGFQPVRTVLVREISGDIMGGSGSGLPAWSSGDIVQDDIGGTSVVTDILGTPTIIITKPGLFSVSWCFTPGAPSGSPPFANGADTCSMYYALLVYGDGSQNVPESIGPPTTGIVTGSGVSLGIGAPIDGEGVLSGFTQSWDGIQTPAVPIIGEAYFLVQPNINAFYDLTTGVGFTGGATPPFGTGSYAECVITQYSNVGEA